MLDQYLYIQTFFFCTVIYSIYKLTVSIFKPNPQESIPEDKIKSAILAYRPDRLIPKQPPENPSQETDKTLIENGIDLIRKDFLSFSKDLVVRKAAADTIRVYGVGTCGPRSFFGTTDLHLQLEKKIAEFVGMEYALVYPFGTLTTSSVIGMYLSRDDVVFVDEFTSESLTNTLIMYNKCTIYRFKHNCPADLYTILENLVESEQLERYESRYLLLEGVYELNGGLCDLPGMVLIAKEFKVRIILDETYTVGVFGRSGGGLTEHFVVPNRDIDLICGSLEPVFGTIGGFCAGTRLAVENQFILSLSFVYSASLSAFLVRSVLECLDRLEEKPERFRRLCKEVHLGLVEMGFEVLSDELAPFQVFKVEDSAEFVESCKRNFGVYLATTKLGLCLRLYHDLCFDGETKKKIFLALKSTKNSTN